MPDIGYGPDFRPELDTRRSVAGRAVLIAAVVVGAVVAAFATSPAEASRAVQAAGPELTRLLRAMAGLKLLFVAGLLAAVAWRLAGPASVWRVASYAAAAAAMAAGPVLIWDMAHVRLGAALLHGGMLVGVVLLWRDPEVGARLRAALAGRRATLHAKSRWQRPLG